MQRGKNVSATCAVASLKRFRSASSRYRIGVQTIRNDHSWFNLYRRRATGSGYWDFYTNIPERNCVGFSIPQQCSSFSGFGIHSGKNMAATVTVKDSTCFSKLADQASIEKRSTIEKFDVHQCRNCIFHSCWLGTRVLPAARQYTTNLRSY
ncbi:unnamed protein product [Heligmosomoides polygyrus]|uniref:Uncharacterized protein n=1 Tax=Heligmosomoides polygyrus TaxID=6339 RepID=A0A3P8FBP2_HELPZ|nr:unnamed protein product [Heligmosomoides polygyrus]